jgi:hypothetical protein
MNVAVNRGGPVSPKQHEEKVQIAQSLLENSILPVSSPETREEERRPRELVRFKDGEQ